MDTQQCTERQKEQKITETQGGDREQLNEAQELVTPKGEGKSDYKLLSPIIVQALETSPHAHMPPHDQQHLENSNRHFETEHFEESSPFEGNGKNKKGATSYNALYETTLPEPSGCVSTTPQPMKRHTSAYTHCSKGGRHTDKENDTKSKVKFHSESGQTLPSITVSECVCKLKSKLKLKSPLTTFSRSESDMLKSEMLPRPLREANRSKQNGRNGNQNTPDFGDVCENEHGSHDLQNPSSQLSMSVASLLSQVAAIPSDSNRPMASSKSMRKNTRNTSGKCQAIAIAYKIFPGLARRTESDTQKTTNTEDPSGLGDAEPLSTTLQTDTQAEIEKHHTSPRFVNKPKKRVENICTIPERSEKKQDKDLKKTASRKSVQTLLTFSSARGESSRFTDKAEKGVDNICSTPVLDQRKQEKDSDKTSSSMNVETLHTSPSALGKRGHDTDTKQNESPNSSQISNASSSGKEHFSGASQTNCTQVEHTAQPLIAETEKPQRRMAWPQCRVVRNLFRRLVNRKTNKSKLISKEGESVAQTVDNSAPPYFDREGMEASSEKKKDQDRSCLAVPDENMEVKDSLDHPNSTTRETKTEQNGTPGSASVNQGTHDHNSKCPSSPSASTDKDVNNTERTTDSQTNVLSEHKDELFPNSKSHCHGGEVLLTTAVEHKSEALCRREAAETVALTQKLNPHEHFKSQSAAAASTPDRNLSTETAAEVLTDEVKQSDPRKSSPGGEKVKSETPETSPLSKSESLERNKSCRQEDDQTANSNVDSIHTPGSPFLRSRKSARTSLSSERTMQSPEVKSARCLQGAASKSSNYFKYKQKAVVASVSLPMDLHLNTGMSRSKSLTKSKSLCLDKRSSSKLTGIRDDKPLQGTVGSLDTTFLYSKETGSKRRKSRRNVTGESKDQKWIQNPCYESMYSANPASASESNPRWKDSSILHFPSLPDESRQVAKSKKNTMLRSSKPVRASSSTLICFCHASRKTRRHDESLATQALAEAKTSRAKTWPQWRHVRKVFRLLSQRKTAKFQSSGGDYASAQSPLFSLHSPITVDVTASAEKENTLHGVYKFTSSRTDRKDEGHKLQDHKKHKKKGTSSTDHHSSSLYDQETEAKDPGKLVKSTLLSSESRENEQQTTCLLNQESYSQISLCPLSSSSSAHEDRKDAETETANKGHMKDTFLLHSKSRRHSRKESLARTDGCSTNELGRRNATEGKALSPKAILCEQRKSKPVAPTHDQTISSTPSADDQVDKVISSDPRERSPDRERIKREISKVSPALKSEPAEKQLFPKTMKEHHVDAKNKTVHRPDRLALHLPKPAVCFSPSLEESGQGTQSKKREGLRKSKPHSASSSSSSWFSCVSRKTAIRTELPVQVQATEPGKAPETKARPKQRKMRNIFRFFSKQKLKNHQPRDEEDRSAKPASLPHRSPNKRDCVTTAKKETATRVMVKSTGLCSGRKDINDSLEKQEGTPTKGSSLSDHTGSPKYDQQAIQHDHGKCHNSNKTEADNNIQQKSCLPVQDSQKSPCLSSSLPSTGKAQPNTKITANPQTKHDMEHLKNSALLQSKFRHSGQETSPTAFDKHKNDTLYKDEAKENVLLSPEHVESQSDAVSPSPDRNMSPKTTVKDPVDKVILNEIGHAGRRVNTKQTDTYPPPESESGHRNSSPKPCNEHLKTSEKSRSMGKKVRDRVAFLENAKRDSDLRRSQSSKFPASSFVKQISVQRSSRSEGHVHLTKTNSKEHALHSPTFPCFDEKDVAEDAEEQKDKERNDTSSADHSNSPRCDRRTMVQNPREHPDSALDQAEVRTIVTPASELPDEETLSMKSMSFSSSSSSAEESRYKVTPIPELSKQKTLSLKSVLSSSSLSSSSLSSLNSADKNRRSVIPTAELLTEESVSLKSVSPSSSLPSAHKSRQDGTPRSEKPTEDKLFKKSMSTSSSLPPAEKNDVTLTSELLTGGKLFMRSVSPSSTSLPSTDTNIHTVTSESPTEKQLFMKSTSPPSSSSSLPPADKHRQAVTPVTELPTEDKLSMKSALPSSCLPETDKNRQTVQPVNEFTVEEKVFIRPMSPSSSSLPPTDKQRQTVTPVSELPMEDKLFTKSMPPSPSSSSAADYTRHTVTPTPKFPHHDTQSLTSVIPSVLSSADEGLNKSGMRTVSRSTINNDDMKGQFSSQPKSDCNDRKISLTIFEGCMNKPLGKDEEIESIISLPKAKPPRQARSHLTLLSSTLGGKQVLKSFIKDEVVQSDSCKNTLGREKAETSEICSHPGSELYDKTSLNGPIDERLQDSDVETEHRPGKSANSFPKPARRLSALNSGLDSLKLKSQCCVHKPQSNATDTPKATKVKAYGNGVHAETDIPSPQYSLSPKSSCVLSKTSPGTLGTHADETLTFGSGTETTLLSSKRCDVGLEAEPLKLGFAQRPGSLHCGNENPSPQRCDRTDFSAVQKEANEGIPPKVPMSPKHETEVCSTSSSYHHALDTTKSKGGWKSEIFLQGLRYPKDSDIRFARFNERIHVHSEKQQRTSQEANRPLLGGITTEQHQRLPHETQFKSADTEGSSTNTNQLTLIKQLVCSSSESEHSFGCHNSDEETEFVHSFYLTEFSSTPLRSQDLKNRTGLDSNSVKEEFLSVFSAGVDVAATPNPDGMGNLGSKTQQERNSQLPTGKVTTRRTNITRPRTNRSSNVPGETLTPTCSRTPGRENHFTLPSRFFRESGSLSSKTANRRVTPKPPSSADSPANRSIENTPRGKALATSKRRVGPQRRTSDTGLQRNLSYKQSGKTTHGSKLAKTDGSVPRWRRLSAGEDTSSELQLVFDQRKKKQALLSTGALDKGYPAGTRTLPSRATKKQLTLAESDRQTDVRNIYGYNQKITLKVHPTTRQPTQQSLRVTPPVSLSGSATSALGSRSSTIPQLCTSANTTPGRYSNKNCNPKTRSLPTKRYAPPRSLPTDILTCTKSTSLENEERSKGANPTRESWKFSPRKKIEKSNDDPTDPGDVLVYYCNPRGELEKAFNRLYFSRNFIMNSMLRQ